MIWLSLLSLVAVVGHSACQQAAGLELMLQWEDWNCTQYTRAKGTTKAKSKERQRATDTET